MVAPDGRLPQPGAGRPAPGWKWNGNPHAFPEGFWYRLHEGELAMTGRHPGRQGRLLARGAALLTGLLLLGLAGCGEKIKSFTYDPPPETTSQPCCSTSGAAGRTISTSSADPASCSTGTGRSGLAAPRHQ